MTGRLKDKSAIVTGGSRGIGRAIVNAFSSEGARVLTCGRGSEPDDLPNGCQWMTADVARASDVESLVAKAKDSFGQIDVLVNNAGVQIEKTVVESTEADWDLVMGINAKAVFLLCRHAIPVMAEAGGGAIINIGSISGQHADPSMAIYNASKGFVHALTRSLAVDHGAEGIRCNAICPGWIGTAMAEAAFDQASDPAAARSDALARHPLGRFGRPEDIAKTAVWLASDDAAFVTGQMVTVDGGLIAATSVRPALF